MGGGIEIVHDFFPIRIRDPIKQGIVAMIGQFSDLLDRQDLGVRHPGLNVVGDRIKLNGKGFPQIEAGLDPVDRLGREFFFREGDLEGENFQVDGESNGNELFLGHDGQLSDGRGLGENHSLIDRNLGLDTKDFDEGVPDARDGMIRRCNAAMDREENNRGKRNQDETNAQVVFHALGR